MQIIYNIFEIMSLSLCGLSLICILFQSLKMLVQMYLKYITETERMQSPTHTEKIPELTLLTDLDSDL